MSKTTTLLFLNTVIILFLCAACKEKIETGAGLFHTSNSKVITIDVENVSSEIIKVDDILDSVKFTALETADDCLIDNIDKIIYHDNKYYVLDCRKTRSLLCFDTDGRFVRKFGSVGQGPGEYVEPTDFMILLFRKTMKNYAMETMRTFLKITKENTIIFQDSLSKQKINCFLPLQIKKLTGYCHI
jgi:hypothetical protein